MLRADALGHEVRRQRQLVVLLLEREVQGVEYLPRDVPMEIVGLEIEGVGVREQSRQALRDPRAMRIADPEVHVLDGLLSVSVR